MPPRIRSPARCAHLSIVTRSATPCSASAALLRPAVTARSPVPRHYATAVASSGLAALKLPADYVPPTQPPSARPPEARKSQLLRTYTSLLRSTPLILIFQHNNLTALEWAALRRELRAALANVPPMNVPAPDAAASASVPVDISSSIQLQVIRTRMFGIALKVVEFFDPATVPAAAKSTDSKAKAYNHDLSQAAYEAIEKVTEGVEALPQGSSYAQLAPALVGPLALLTLPAVSPAHLAAALSILAPNAPAFPPPTRKKSPGYYDLPVQSALQKLLLIGGRIEGKVFDLEGVRWVGGIDGGIDGLRAQLIAMLQSAGFGLTTTLEGASKSLWLTMESRRSVLEEEAKGDETESAKQES